MGPPLPGLDGARNDRVAPASLVMEVTLVGAVGPPPAGGQGTGV
jgi:hypothetical protein